ncbi:MAG: glycosyltransferase [Acidobacteriota bacterium]|nr:glycosyltransferase [Acidobacteriota bacterium]
MPKERQVWHVLDVGSIWLKEFASALGEMVPTQNWCPQIRNFGSCEDWEETDPVLDPPLTMTRFPLQRGYARFPFSLLLHPENAIVKRLLGHSRNAGMETLVCTSPFYAPIAELWPGKVVYYLTDLTKAYEGINSSQVIELDGRMCQVAETVCPNSTRIADYLSTEAHCDPGKIKVVPNATRTQNILSWPLIRPAELPANLASLPRPIVGVIGNMAANLDWILIKDAVNRARDVSWAFIGPTSMHIPNPAHRRARQAVMQLRDRVLFTGPQPYGELYRYARALDVALIPYLKQEPTRSGSATRFYEHLAACRPILATRGHDELLTKEPLLTLVDTASDIAQELGRLRALGFRDGHEELRWQVSHNQTWHSRARAVLEAAGLEGLHNLSVDTALPRSSDVA